MVSRSAHAVARSPLSAGHLRVTAAGLLGRWWGRWGPGEPGAGRPSVAVAVRRVIILAVVAALAGVAVAGLLLPAVSTVGLASKASADHFLSLPADFQAPPLATDSRIVAADGSLVAVLHGDQDRTAVTIKQVPLVMQRAIVAIEDSRFYDHKGVDVRGLMRAALRNSSSGTVQQGGSTITQQYVKNVLLEEATTPKEREAAAGDSVDRKLRELRYAAELEHKLTKQQILERYLNIAYFGQGAYGIGTASERYFHIPISKVNLGQAAMLAGLVQSPTAYDPFVHPTAARARRDTVLDRMAQLKVISAKQATFAKLTPLGTVPARTLAADSCSASGDPFFCDYVRTSLLANPALGATVADRERRLDEGGLTIRTTLDPKVQAAAQRAVDSTISRTSRVAAVAVVVQPGTGDIVAMAVNRGYGTGPGKTKVALPTTPAFQPGSTFKMFTLAAALQDGYGVNTHFNAPACLDHTIYDPGDASSGRAAGGVCRNGFVNDDPAEAGVYDLRKATADSVNTYYIQLEEKVGVLGVKAMAERLGVPTARLAKVGGADGSLTLGTFVVSPLDMATAYATIAARGIRCAPRYLAGALDSQHHVVPGLAKQPSCVRAINSGVADTVANVLTSVITSGTGHPNADIGRPAAGKTGTTEKFYSAWFVGFTPQLAAAVEMGDPRGPNRFPLQNVFALGHLYSPGVYGGDLPAIAWSRLMTAALAGEPALPIPAMNPVIARGTKPDPYVPPKKKTPPRKPGKGKKPPVRVPKPPIVPQPTAPTPTQPVQPVPTWPPWVPGLGGQPIS